jgi:uncharacterized protein (DUF1697 family)
MTTHLALLCGINIGKNKRIAMVELRAMFADLGHRDITTYIASGNVLFATKDHSPPKLAGEISDAIEATFGFDVAVVVLDTSELAAIAGSSPFADRIADPKHLIVTVLSGAPDRGVIDALVAAAYLPEEFAAVDRSIHIHTPDGQAGMQLHNAFWEKLTGLTATTRTWRTMTTLLKMSSGQ